MQVRPTLEAILDILGIHAEIDRDAGVIRDRSLPACHHADVPARDHPLLADWYHLRRGRVAGADGALVALRAGAALDLLDGALARTMPLVHLLVADGPPEAARWLACFHAHVETIRARACSEVVLDHVDARALRLLGEEPHAELARRLAAAPPPDHGPLPPPGEPRGLRHLGLAMCLRDMQRTGRGLQAAALRLAAALDSTGELPGPALARALLVQTDGLRRNLRDLELAGYLERIRRPGRHDAPGTYACLRARFAPLADAPLATDAELLATSAHLLAIVAGCLDDAPALLASADR